MALLFGLNLDPAVSALEETYQFTQYADQHGIDLVTIQDHPYNRTFLETWTLLAVLAAKTERVHLGTNVANIPLRPPAMLAKQAATLDILSQGRVELGIGAGAFWQGVVAYGGKERTPREAYTGFEDALHIIRGLWGQRPFSYAGEMYQVQGAQPGPAPAHPIRIWVGALGPKMLRLTGRMADGILVSTPYIPPERLPEVNAAIDEGAAEAGRAPTAIRRGYNVPGIIDVGQGVPGRLQPGIVAGKPQDWVNILREFHTEYRMDTFLFSPIGDQPFKQVQAFAQEVIPALREAGV